MSHKETEMPTIIAREYIPIGEGGLVNGLPLELPEVKYEEMRSAAEVLHTHVCTEVNGIRVCCVGNGLTPDLQGLNPAGRNLTYDERESMLTLGSMIEIFDASKEDLPIKEVVFDPIAFRDENRERNLRMYNNVNRISKPSQPKHKRGNR